MFLQAAFFYGCNGETSLQPKGVISIGTVFRKKGDAEPSPVSVAAVSSCNRCRPVLLGAGFLPL